MLAALGAIHSYSKLKAAVKDLQSVQKSDIPSRYLKTKEVLEYAIAYTVHQNQLIASLLSLIPLVKPIVRLTQGIIYDIQERDRIARFKLRSIEDR